MILNKNNPTPLYYQLAEQIREQIQTGELEPGAQLPSERELSERFEISRMTVRQAVGYLVQQGMLVAQKGIGTFVADPKLTYDALHLLGFTEEVMRQGGTATSRVLEQAVVPPPVGVASRLDLKPDETTVRIVRLRLSENTPLLLETIFVPTLLCPGLEHENLATQSLYAILEQQYGLHLKRARQIVEATTANHYESELFGIEPGMAMILLEGVTYDHQERPVEFFKAIYRGDRFKFELESQRAVTFETANTPRISVLLA
jgi:GntR family transcriptional regulator